MWRSQLEALANAGIPAIAIDLPGHGARVDQRFSLTVPEPGATDVLAGGVPLEVMDDVLPALTRLHPVADLRSIQVPVLLVNGRFDHLRLHARRYLAATSRGRLVTIPGATHTVSLIQPARFTAIMLAGYADATGIVTGR